MADQDRCPRCSGTGDKNPAASKWSGPCPDCDGTGRKPTDMGDLSPDETPAENIAISAHADLPDEVLDRAVGLAHEALASNTPQDREPGDLSRLTKPMAELPRPIIEAVAPTLIEHGRQQERAMIANSLGRHPDGPPPPEIDQPLAELIRAAEARGAATEQERIKRLADRWVESIEPLEDAGKSGTAYLEYKRGFYALLAALDKEDGS